MILPIAPTAFLAIVPPLDPRTLVNALLLKSFLRAPLIRSSILPITPAFLLFVADSAASLTTFFAVFLTAPSPASSAASLRTFSPTLDLPAPLLANGFLILSTRPANLDAFFPPAFGVARSATSSIIAPILFALGLPARSATSSINVPFLNFLPATSDISSIIAPAFGFEVARSATSSIIDPPGTLDLVTTLSTAEVAAVLAVAYFEALSTSLALALEAPFSERLPTVSIPLPRARPAHPAGLAHTGNILENPLLNLPRTLPALPIDFLPALVVIAQAILLRTVS